MEATQLDQQFAAIRTACAAATSQLEHDLRDHEAQRAATQAEIDLLRQKLAELVQRERALGDQLNRQAHLCLEQERDAAVAALQASYDSIRSIQDYWLRCARLDSQLQTLWNSEPTLGTMLEAYRKVEANADAYLSTFPEIMRDAIAQTLRVEQEKLRGCVAPWLDLQAQRQGIRPDHPLTLQILVAHDPGDALIAWALPFPADEAALPSDGAPVLVAAANAVVAALGSFGKHPEWNIDDLDSAAWEGFSVVLALASYRGERPLAEATHVLLTKLLPETAPFRDVVLDLRVDQIPYPAWREGRQGVSILPAQEHGDASDDTPARQPLIEITQGWYTDDDVRTWGRKEGKLPPQARRLRTLLMRMIGRGMVGGDAAPIELLWEALPSGHDQDMRQGIAALVDAGVLQQANGAAKAPPTVTINPAMLGDVQSLINREPTAFWSEIIGQPAPMPVA